MRTTIEMAREAAGDDWGLFQEYMPEIHRLAELVRADERARMAEQPAQQEPVAWISKHGVVYPFDAKDEVHPINDLQPLYTSPPAQRSPLTDEQIKKVLTKAIRAGKVTWLGYEQDEDGEYTIPSLSANIYQISRAIEAAHGIKENT